MMSENGRIIAVEDQAVWVETIRQSTCQSCSAQKACGHGLLSKMQSGHQVHVRVLPGVYPLEDFSVGDQVSISVPERVVLQGALLVYLLPLLTLLLGAGLAESVLTGLPNDLAAFMGAALGFSLGIALVKLCSRWQRHDTSYQPVVTSLQKSTQSALLSSELSLLRATGPTG